MKPILIGAASGWGARIQETELGPQALRKFLDASYQWGGVVHASTSYTHCNIKAPADALDIVVDHVHRLAEHAYHVARHQKLPVIVGGDHACAIGTWSGVTAALHAEGKFGLIWIDAHMDSHTLVTSPSGAFHGMPIACLLGEGEEAFTKLMGDKYKISPEHICLIGVRSYETGEEALLEKYGVRVYKMEEVRSRGFDTVYQEALKRVRTGTKGYGVSIDLDAFDPKDAPGVGSREAGGLHREEVLESLKYTASDKAFRALEIAEYNPKRDSNHKTALLVQDILENIFM